MKIKLLPNHCFTGMLSCFLLGSALILLFVEGKSSGTVVALLLLNSLVLTFMLIRTLLFPEHVPNLILADCDENGIPVKIYEVCATDLLNYCRTEYSLEYYIDHWEAVRENLNKMIEKNDKYRPFWENCLRRGRALSLKDWEFAIRLSYFQNGLFIMKIITPHELSAPEDIAIQVIKANHPNTKVFYSIGELAKWNMTSPLEKREAIGMKIDDFLRRRSRS